MRAHTRFDNMKFPDYEFRAYPKMLQFPRALPAGLPPVEGLPDGSKKKDAEGNDLAIVEGGEWKSVPMTVIAETPEEEERLLKTPPRGAVIAVVDPADEIAALRRRLAELGAASATESPATPSEYDDLVRLAGERGIAVDKRWGIEKLRQAVA